MFNFDDNDIIDGVLTLTLYIDESYEVWEPNVKNGGIYHTKILTLAGLILSDKQQLDIEKRLNEYKQNLFGKSDVILHANEINAFSPIYQFGSDIWNKRTGEILSSRPEYDVYKTGKNYQGYSKNIETILNTSQYSGQLLASTINITKYKKMYEIQDSVIHQACFSDLLEMFALFIKFYKKQNKDVNVVGKVVFENNSQNSYYFQRFVDLLAVGTSVVTPKDLQVIKGIDFINKEDNNAALQVIDVLPHRIGIGSMIKYKLKQKHITKVTYDEEMKKVNKQNLNLKYINELYFKKNNDPRKFGYRIHI